MSIGDKRRVVVVLLLLVLFDSRSRCNIYYTDEREHQTRPLNLKKWVFCCCFCIQTNKKVSEKSSIVFKRKFCVCSACKSHTSTRKWIRQADSRHVTCRRFIAKSVPAKSRRKRTRKKNSIQTLTFWQIRTPTTTASNSTFGRFHLQMCTTRTRLLAFYRKVSRFPGNAGI